MITICFTRTKIEDYKIQSFDNLTDTMNTAEIRLSQSASEKMDISDSEGSSGPVKSLTLSDVVGELQNLIIANLHPSAAIALSQTNHHFHACANLHQLPLSLVSQYFREKELLPAHRGEYACYTCMRLKHRSSFAPSQTKSPRGHTGYQ